MATPAGRLQGVENLIRTKQYFLIHAARQSGITTTDTGKQNFLYSNNLQKYKTFLNLTNSI
jgi:hypothetical protein